MYREAYSKNTPKQMCTNYATIQRQLANITTRTNVGSLLRLSQILLRGLIAPHRHVHLNLKC